MANVPRAWYSEVNDTTRRQSVTDNLYSVITRAYQTTVILEQVTTQMSIELQEADRMAANYSEQGKLVVQVAEKMRAKEDKIQLLEEAC